MTSSRDSALGAWRAGWSLPLALALAAVLAAGLVEAALPALTSGFNATAGALVPAAGPPSAGVSTTAKPLGMGWALLTLLLTGLAGLLVVLGGARSRYAWPVALVTGALYGALVLLLVLIPKLPPGYVAPRVAAEDTSYHLRLAFVIVTTLAGCIAGTGALVSILVTPFRQPFQ